MIEINTILGIIGSILALILWYIRRRQDTLPERKDKEIDNAIQSADDVSRINHILNDRMRNKDSSNK